MRILVVGASGYIGGRLVPRLAELDHELVLMSRDERSLGARFPGARIVVADLLEPESLPAALEGVDVAYYLAHAMGGKDPDFAERDRRAARSFGRAAAKAGVGRIVYLGGLGDDDAELSHHLASRHETGEELAAAGVPVTEFRAAVIIGSGSASFEILRHLTERLPVMITPRWVATRCQPIGIRDVLEYLAGALDHPEITGIVEIGGPDILSYGDMMREYARVRGLRRLMIPVPVLTPRLSSYWVSLVSPVPSGIARPLIEGLRTEVVVRHPGPASAFGIQPLGYRAALERAVDRTHRQGVETTWFDALATPDKPGLTSMSSREGMIIERRQRDVPAPTGLVFAEVERLGGRAGWPYLNVLWRIRGLMDRAVGRGRHAPRAPRSRPPAGGRRGGLLAGGGGPPPEAAPPAGRDEGARPSLAPVRGAPARRRLPPRPGGVLRAQGPARPRVLVRALPRARDDLPRHGPRPRRAGGACGGPRTP